MKLHLYGASTAVACLAAFGAAAPAAAEGKKVCYAFQDLSTGFWVAGHKAIVTTLRPTALKSSSSTAARMPTGSSSRSRTVSPRAQTASY